MNAKQPPMTQRQPHSTPNCSTPQVKIRQQNVNKLLTAQSDLLYWLNPTEYDMAALQEPYLYHNHNSQANPHWYVIYPKEHYLWPGKTRSIILVNRQMAMDAWLQVDFGSSDIMAIQVRMDSRIMLIVNMYNDKAQKEALKQSLQVIRRRACKANSEG